LNPTIACIPCRDTLARTKKHRRGLVAGNKPTFPQSNYTKLFIWGFCFTGEVVIMDKAKNINVSINPGDAFFSDSITIADNEERFVLDFKQTSPRFDPVSLEQSDQQTSIVIKHNTVVISAALAKVLNDLLGERIKQHEKMFGTIKKPAKKKEKELVESVGKPTYFG
jgi:hypothetical protein